MKVISRAEAKAAGLKHYFTGKPCSKKHVLIRYVSSGRCSECSRQGVSPHLPTRRNQIKAHPDYISLDDARRLSLSRFFTGVPCAHGHTAERHVVNGKCLVCVAEKRKYRTARLKARGLNWRGAPAQITLSRKQAIAKNLKTYISATPCPGGHTERYTCNGRCFYCGIGTKRRNRKLLTGGHYCEKSVSP